LRRSERPLTNSKTYDRPRQVGKCIASPFLRSNFLSTHSHVTLYRADDRAVFAAGKADRTYPPVLLAAEVGLHLRRVAADVHCAVGRERDY
jgi:hypothetical protein